MIGSYLARLGGSMGYVLTDTLVVPLTLTTKFATLHMPPQTRQVCSAPGLVGRLPMEEMIVVIVCTFALLASCTPPRYCLIDSIPPPPPIYSSGFLGYQCVVVGYNAIAGLLEEAKTVPSRRMSLKPRC